ncbi:nucleolar and coiled-body phosphoprotein 1-like [Littorina saxatilis]|uniref:nucleolar and coiled-body phosphoprotein 1-like n=1 Tax=Littorina saxatilis TaxID=31220 RepID=UPI0038B61A10
MEDITAKKRKKKQGEKNKEPDHLSSENRKHLGLSTDSLTQEYRLTEFFSSLKMKKKKSKKKHKEEDGASELGAKDLSPKTKTDRTKELLISDIGKTKKGNSSAQGDESLETEDVNGDFVESSQSQIDEDDGLRQFSKMITSSYDPSSLDTQSQEQDTCRPKKSKKKRKLSEQNSVERESIPDTTIDSQSETQQPGSSKKKKKKKKKKKRKLLEDLEVDTSTEQNSVEGESFPETPADSQSETQHPGSSKKKKKKKKRKLLEDLEVDTSTEQNSVEGESVPETPADSQSETQHPGSPKKKKRTKKIKEEPYFDGDTDFDSQTPRSEASSPSKTASASGVQQSSQSHRAMDVIVKKQPQETAFTCTCSPNELKDGGVFEISYLNSDASYFQNPPSQGSKLLKVQTGSSSKSPEKNKSPSKGKSVETAASKAARNEGGKQSNKKKVGKRLWLWEAGEESVEDGLHSSNAGLQPPAPDMENTQNSNSKSSSPTQNSNSKSSSPTQNSNSKSSSPKRKTPDKGRKRKAEGGRDESLFEGETDKDGCFTSNADSVVKKREKTAVDGGKRATSHSSDTDSDSSSSHLDIDANAESGNETHGSSISLGTDLNLIPRGGRENKSGTVQEDSDSVNETISEYSSPLHKPNALSNPRQTHHNLSESDEDEAEGTDVVAQKTKSVSKKTKDKPTNGTLRKEKTKPGKGPDTGLDQYSRGVSAKKSRMPNKALFKSKEFIESDDSSLSDSTQMPSKSNKNIGDESRPKHKDLHNSKQNSRGNHVPGPSRFQAFWSGKTCYICDAVMADRDTYIEHLAECHDKLSYQCKKCLKCMTSRMQVRNHLDVSCGLKEASDMITPFRCKLCPLVYSHGSSCRRHEASEHNLHPNLRTEFKCQHCTMEFTRAHRLRQHVEKCREGLLLLPPALWGDKGRMCEECGKAYASKQSLSYHKRTMHRHERFICMCGKKFLGSTHYYKHSNQCQERISLIR